MSTPDPRYLNLFRRIARTVEPTLQEIREHRLTGEAPANEQVALIAVAAVLAEQHPPGPAVARGELATALHAKACGCPGWFPGDPEDTQYDEAAADLIARFAVHHLPERSSTDG